MKGDVMSKGTKQFFEQLKSGEELTFVETVKEAASSVREIGGEIWDGLKPMFDHGRTEAAALLFSGQGHVMYMRGQEGIEQGQDQEQEQSKEMSERQRDDGREM
jgi:hypothetical protein